MAEAKSKDGVSTECRKEQERCYTKKNNEEISPLSLSRDLSHAVKSLGKALS